VVRVDWVSQLVAQLNKWDILQIFILAGMLWFIMRSRAISALRDTIYEQSRRIARLDARLARLESILREHGCAKAATCGDRVPYTVTAIDVDPHSAFAIVEETANSEGR
jgi:hypothetical protein